MNFKTWLENNFSLPSFQEFKEKIKDWRVNMDGEPLCPKCSQKYASKFEDKDTIKVRTKYNSGTKAVTPEELEELKRQDKIEGEPFIVNPRKQAIDSLAPLSDVADADSYQAKEGWMAQCYGEDCTEEVIVPY